MKLIKTLSGITYLTNEIYSGENFLICRTNEIYLIYTHRKSEMIFHDFEKLDDFIEVNIPFTNIDYYVELKEDCMIMQNFKLFKESK
jgi:hypothetical protein